MLDQSAARIVDTARPHRRGLVGPIPLPTEIKPYCVIRGRRSSTRTPEEHFEMRTHKRLIDILDPSSKTVDALMRLSLAAGVDIEIKM